MKVRWLAVSLALVLSGAVGVGLGSVAADTAKADAPLPAAAAVEKSSPLATGTFAKLAETVKPAVINVNTESKGDGRTQFEEYFGEEFFRKHFGNPPERMPRRSPGSGVIIDAAGIALTNAHVVDRGKQVEVVLLDGSKYKATVVGVDKKTDLAVLKFEDAKRRFPFVPLGDSDEVQVGDWVIAVGSPFGLQATVTSGIISAKARQIGAGPFDDFLQTDAAINPGNSGGPLVNMKGEVIGINTAIHRGGSGIGFAIPANLAKRISTELVASGSVTRGWLGVSLQPLTPELARSFGVKGSGALIADVVPDSPAARAGLQSGDVVVELNGKKVENPSDVARVVGLARPGQEAKIKVWRDKAERTVQVTLGDTPGERGTSRLGLDVRPVTPDVARELNLRTTDGVVVVNVEEGSPAARAGLQRNDVIREVDRKAVKTVADFERLTADRKGESLTFRVQRGPSALYVAVPLDRS